MALKGRLGSRVNTPSGRNADTRLPLLLSLPRSLARSYSLSIYIQHSFCGNQLERNPLLLHLRLLIRLATPTNYDSVVSVGLNGRQWMDGRSTKWRPKRFVRSLSL